MGNFDESVPGGRNINADLAVMHRLYGVGKILLEVIFPGSCYPSKPFLLRVVRPRMAWYTGSPCLAARTLVRFLVNSLKHLHPGQGRAFKQYQPGIFWHLKAGQQSRSRHGGRLSVPRGPLPWQQPKRLGGVLHCGVHPAPGANDIVEAWCFQCWSCCCVQVIDCEALWAMSRREEQEVRRLEGEQVRHRTHACADQQWTDADTCL